MLRLAHSENYPIHLPEGHRFPVLKYELVRQQLEYEGVIQQEQLYSPEFVNDAEVTLVHSPDYWSRVKEMKLSEKEIRRLGFPNTGQLIWRSLSSSSGTLRAAEYALLDGCGMNLAGGTHHAFYDKGEGFCVLNDIAIAAAVLLQRKHIQKALVVDLDVHQGNGTASIFKDEPRVVTFSMHCAQNYPEPKEKSDYDLDVPAGTGDETYLEQLSGILPEIIEKTAPDLIFYQSGVDVLAGDRLGKLKLTLEGCQRRDKKVISLAAEKKIPLVVVMGGGYSHSLSKLVRAHSNTYKTAIGFYDKKSFFQS